MRELSAVQKDALKKRIRRVCCDMVRKMGMTAAFTSTGIRAAQGSTAYVFDFKWNHLSNMWDLYHGDTWLAGRSQSYPNAIMYVVNHGVPHGN
jgi:hypothetical protein